MKKINFKKTKKILNTIFSNFPVKLICLLIAFGIWVYVGMGQTRIDTFPGKIPLEFQNTPAGLVALSDIDAVSVKIVAASNVWRGLSAGSFHASIDLSSYSKGTFELPIIVTSNVSEVQIVEINPAKVLVSLEKISQKEIPINLQIEGKPADGYVVGDWQIKPATVQVSGPSSVVERILEATAKVSLAGEKEEVVRIVRAIALDAQGNEIKRLSFAPQEVSVTIPLVPASAAKTVGIKVITTGQPAEGFWISKIETEPASLTVTASSSLINQLSFLETKEVDVSGISQDKELTTSLKQNPGIIILDGVSNIKVKISVSPIASTRQMKVGFTWENLADNLKVSSINPSEGVAVFSGSTKDLSGLNPSDTTIAIGLGQFNNPGTYSLDISKANVYLPSGVTLVSIVPSAVNIELLER